MSSKIAHQLITTNYELHKHSSLSVESLYQDYLQAAKNEDTKMTRAELVQFCSLIFNIEYAGGVLFDLRKK